MRVNMLPGMEATNNPNGISRVIEAYLQYGPEYGIQFTKQGEPYDIKAVHAGMTGADCDVAILHGMYFTGDYPASNQEYEMNKRIIQAVRAAKVVTVPSSWVAEIFQRDARISPFVVPHGIDYSLWEHNYEHEGYVLYNKNRDGQDVCNSVHLDMLANSAHDVKFMTTFSRERYDNTKVIGVVPHNVMRKYVQKAMVYLSSTKETFGIGILEAMASGVPVLGWRYGGNVDIVQHQVTGYLADPGDYEDLERGLRYCIKYRDVLSQNSLELVKNFTWDKAIEKLKVAFQAAIDIKNRPVNVSVIIPTYNYAHKVEAAIHSAVNQTLKPSEIIVVNDGSTDDLAGQMVGIIDRNRTSRVNISLIHKPNGGVATARNVGGSIATSKYLCFMDADDQIAPEFLETCVEALEQDNSLYIAYTRLKWVKEDGREGVSQWPGEYNFDEQISRKNQIPTCCVMRREVFDRLGGYRQKFAPAGAGSEDAEFWTRAGDYGMGGRLVSDNPLFTYSVGHGNTQKAGYEEPDWLGHFPWMKNYIHPFMSLATPKRRSHNVYQYDQPVISVVIPVGENHINYVYDALDSIEQQTYRNWEAIVVLDSTDVKFNHTAYPYAKVFVTPKTGSGPGVARNIGAKNARGYFLLFLDADDMLEYNAMDQMIKEWNLKEGIVYSDYYGLTKTDESNLSVFGDRLVSYNKHTKIAKVRHRATPYDCKRAQDQPQTNAVYHWCIVSCLIPTEWHNSIGGFDEDMESWEDVDYHWRMAHKGYCYSLIQEPLISYRFSTGSRREAASSESSGQTASKLLQYMSNKYKDVEMSPCRSCPGGEQSTVHLDPPLQSALMRMQSNTQISQIQRAGALPMSDENFVEIYYNHPNKGDHPVVGPVTKTAYGYRSGGDRFIVHVLDQQAMPDVFALVDAQTVRKPERKPVDVKEPVAIKPIAAPTTKVEPPVSVNDAPASLGVSVADSVDTPEIVGEAEQEPRKNLYNINERMDFQAIPGVTERIANELVALGIVTPNDLLNSSDETLLGISGVGKTRINIIRKWITENTEDA